MPAHMKTSGPDCPCTPVDTCTIFTDAFNRSDSTSLGSDWSETNGDWSIASNKLTLASPADGKIALYAGAALGSRVTASISGGSNGDKPGLIIGYTDANNYDAVYLHFHSSAPQIIRRKRVAGVDADFTLSFAGLTPGSTHTLMVDYDTTTFGSIEPKLLVYVDGDVAYTCDSTILGCDTVSSSASWGAACAGGSGTMTWDDFSVGYNYNDNTSCPVRSQCGCCPPSSVTEWEINISGFTNAGVGCTSCTALNGVYTITNVDCVQELSSTITLDTPACDSGGNATYFQIRFTRNWSTGTFLSNGCQFIVELLIRRVSDNVVIDNGSFALYMNGECTGTAHTIPAYGSGLIGVCVTSTPTITVEGIP